MSVVRNIIDRMKILILCTGNSCRSQMAQGFMQSFDQEIEVYSAGTNPSGKVNQRAIEVMKESGIDISNHTSDSVDKYLNEKWDYVITVCDGAKEICPVFIGNVNHRLHLGFEDPSFSTGSDEFILSEFRRIRDEIRAAFWQFYLENIRRK